MICIATCMSTIELHYVYNFRFTDSHSDVYISILKNICMYIRTQLMIGANELIEINTIIP